MPEDKRNNFLDAGDSDNDSDARGYDSEADDLQKGGRSIAKKRKINEEPESDEEDRFISKKSKKAATTTTTERRKASSDDEDDLEDADAQLDKDDDEEEDGEEGEGEEEYTTELPDISRTSLTKRNLVATEKAIKKSGLIYISRVPPFMKPQKLRSLLEPYGTINRIFLSPEDPESQKRRVKAGGNKKRSFVDGWVEYTNKKDAKTVVSLLNARTIGGPKGSYYRDDVWSMIYLKGFKWHNLTEQIATEAAERTSRIRAEITKATKENRDFVRNIERAKVMDGMEANRAAKKSRKEGVEGTASTVASVQNEGGEKRKFKQASAGKKGGDNAPEDAKRVLSKLF